MPKGQTTVRSTVGFSKEDHLQCPFVPSHFLRRDKFAGHLDKCRKNLDKTSPFYAKAWSMVQCKFNVTHYFLPEQTDRHYNDCESRKMFINQTEELKYEWENLTHVVPDRKQTFGEDEEDWDNEVPVAAYDPKKKVLNNPDILYIPQGQLSKSQRQLFRQKRRHMKNGGESFEWPSEDGSSDFGGSSENKSGTQDSSKNKSDGKKGPNNVKIQKSVVDDWDEPEAKSSSNFTEDWGTSDSVVDDWSVADDDHSDNNFASEVDHDDWEPDLKGPAMERDKVKPLRRPNPLGSDLKPSNMGRGSKLDCSSSIVSDSTSVSGLGRGSGALLLTKRYIPAPPTTMALGRGIGRGVSPAPPPGFYNSVPGPFSATPLGVDQAAFLIARDMNKMNLNPENNVIRPPGLGRGRGTSK